MSSNFVSGDEIPVQDNDYVTKNEEIPVQDDLKEVEDPIDENVADSDEQLGKSFSIVLFFLSLSFFVCIRLSTTFPFCLLPCSNL